MVILNADHPDVEDFIWCKAVEERKARVLRDNGFDMDLDGKDSHSTQYQNANNSVRVTDEFMEAVVADADWHLRAVTTGEPVRTVKARDLFRQIAEAAWECADPGMQFDTTINTWHTASNTGRINASNPCCFTGETLVDTSWGLVRIEQLQKTADALQELPLAWSFDGATGEYEFRSIRRAWVAGHTDTLVDVRTEAGLVLRCTPEHRFLTAGDGFVEAQALAIGARLRSVDPLGAGVADSVASVTAVVLGEAVPVYDLEIDGTHTFCVASEAHDVEHSVVVHNSEYMHLDNSACNLASLNLLKFLNDDGSFDVEGFRAAVRVVFTAQEILVGNADYPTESIADTSRRFRQLGLGYANLGALLMAIGAAYDSDGGRAWAAAITALMTGEAYATSARTAARMGPFAGYAQNKEPMNRVLGMHRDALDAIDRSLAPSPVVAAACDAWDDAIGLAEIYGVRNSQATVLAPTGCLVGGTLVPTERGLVRLRSLGDPDGAQWQDLGIDVATDEGPRAASKFYVNGLEPVVSVETARGYRIQGTPQHRVKVVNEATGGWDWKRFADIGVGDLVPLAMNQLVGGPQAVPLPPLPEAYWTGEHHLEAPRRMTPELAELVGYFMGDGSIHAWGLRFCVADTDFDVVERLERLGKEVFRAAAHITPKAGYTEVAFHSIRLVLWWEACGFAKHAPSEGHAGKGYAAHIPDAVLHSNDPEVYRGFLRGLFEADGTVTAGVPSFSSTTLDLAADVQALLLALGYPTTRRLGTTRTGWGRAPIAVLRLVNAGYARRWAAEIGFMSDRKGAAVTSSLAPQTGRGDHIPLSRPLVDRLAPDNDRLRRVLLLELSRAKVSRRIAEELFERTGDAELGRLLSFYYDRVSSSELGGEELTYDLSVPDNVTYVANGFVSHNTIGLMMDCDTTGIEPDLGLCKTKKLVGGGTMSIVNQTVPRALRRLGYGPDQVNEILAYIDLNKSILGAPHLAADHLGVFACSMGDNVIHYLGHVKMMSAVQPWISGAISKCVSADTLVTTADGLVRIGSLYDGEAPDTFRHEILEVASLGNTSGATQKTDAFYYGGVRPVWRAELRSGHRVVGTPNHRLLVAGPAGLEWRRLDELEIDDHVAVQYGSELWSPMPARFDRFVPSATYGSQKRVQLPQEMTSELAFLLGAYAAEGHTTRSTWTIVTNSVDSVLERVAAAWRSEFGLEAKIVRQPGKCPGVVVSSKTVVEFLEHLGCGARASAKRIPDVVLRSPREMVLSFLQGLALDAYVTVVTAPKWAICLDSPALLDDLQAILTNLGVVHGRVSKLNKTNGKTYDEVYATGAQAQRLAEMVPFLEPEKSARAAALSAMVFGNHATADVVPGVTPEELFRLLPMRGAVRTEFHFLSDARTRHVTRRSLERVSMVPGVVLPPWLRTVLDDDLHFSPVQSVARAADREVFDLSVPATHAFVGNGIVNHNTVNVPESATVDEVEQLHIDAWKLGLKALAIYRDNCKVGQPLSTTKTDKAIAEAAAKLIETVVVQQQHQPPDRERLPRMRNSKTFSFRVADCHGYVTVGEYDDGRPGEIFLRVAKQGSTLAGIMDAFAISVSHGLQYGVPLKAFVDMYVNMRFEPAGMTDDPDIRFASSLVDYIFRRLAVAYLTHQERVDLGILTVDERMQPTLPGVEEQATPTSSGSDIVPDPVTAVGRSVSAGRVTASVRSAVAPPQPQASDAPYCYQCGMVMQRAGACFVCSSCGTTSGCS
ncbi:MAG: ribonucleoside-diphosphate reductase alpha chain, partial [Actinomycetota bacterium]|nr:ribonucleoside-diphosphate reductase alpha chain [Actinomycetota bacterium]